MHCFLEDLHIFLWRVTFLTSYSLLQHQSYYSNWTAEELNTDKAAKPGSYYSKWECVFLVNGINEELFSHAPQVTIRTYQFSSIFYIILEILRQYFNLILWQQFCHYSDNKHLSLKYEKLLSSLSRFPSPIHFSYSDTDPVAWRFQTMMSSTFLWSHESPAVPVNTTESR